MTKLVTSDICAGVPCPIRVGRNITKCRLTGLPSGVTADPIAAENMLLNMYSTVC